MNYLEAYYNEYNEDGRLTSQHGQVEYITTQKYIHECIGNAGARKILEIGAGTGRYSIALSREGHDVTALELVDHNIDVMKSKLTENDTLKIVKGNALNLSSFADEEFDITLLLGPMYHLYSVKVKEKALSEAVRVTKKGGHILVAYCMNDPTVVQFVFGKGHLADVIEKQMLTSDWHTVSQPVDLFEMIRTEEIDELNKTVPVERVKLVAADGATNYMRETVDAMDRETFFKWVEYHLSTCERQDLIGASHHTLDILRKV